jgi:uncharacterized protein YecA (UPF0149 family)
MNAAIPDVPPMFNAPATAVRTLSVADVRAMVSRLEALVPPPRTMELIVASRCPAPAPAPAPPPRPSCRYHNPWAYRLYRPLVRVGHCGRNAPCPCGSGKKFKRCHLLAMEGPPCVSS